MEKILNDEVKLIISAFNKIGCRPTINSPWRDPLEDNDDVKTVYSKYSNDNIIIQYHKQYHNLCDFLFIYIYNHDLSEEELKRMRREVRSL